MPNDLFGNKIPSARHLALAKRTLVHLLPAPGADVVASAALLDHSAARHVQADRTVQQLFKVPPTPLQITAMSQVPEGYKCERLTPKPLMAII